MRIAVAGKGGAGKTTISATMARLIARSGTPVCAIDADSNPNLGSALGVTGPVAALPATIVSRRLDGPALKEPVERVLERHTASGPDGVRLALMGMPAHAHEGCLCAAHATVSATLGDLASHPELVTIVDMEASPEHLSRGTARHVDVLLIVTEPYYRSLETVRRLAALAAELPIARVAVVANKVRQASDEDAVRAFCERHNLELCGVVPYSDAVVTADLQAAPVIDRGGPAVTAIAQLSLRVAGPRRVGAR